MSLNRKSSEKYLGGRKQKPYCSVQLYTVLFTSQNPGNQKESICVGDFFVWQAFFLVISTHLIVRNLSAPTSRRPQRGA